jgi:hypothetical protein
MPRPLSITRGVTVAAVILLTALFSSCSAVESAASVSADGAVRDLQFEVPESVKGRRNVHIRILLQDEELFRGSLTAVRQGDFNFTVPDRVLRGGKCTLIVDFFIPPSEVSVAQSIIEVEGGGETSGLELVISLKQIGQIGAAVGSAAVLGLGARQAFQNAGARRGELPVVWELSASPPPPPTAPTPPPPPATLLDRPFVTPAPREPMDQERPTPPMPRISPAIVKSAMQKEFLSNQLASIRNNKVVSAAIGAILLSPVTSAAFRRMQRGKVSTTPVRIVDKQFSRARTVLDKTWNSARLQLGQIGKNGRRRS